jgi:hypothetical protein
VPLVLEYEEVLLREEPDLAVTAGASHIITYNKSDFEGVEDFDIREIKPGAFLKEIGEAE